MPYSLMQSTSELLVHYARDHRDQRNIALHMIGVPLVVFGVGVLLARGAVGPGDPGLSLAWLLWGLTTLWTLSRGHLGIGLTVSLATAALIGLAHLASGGSVVQWLTCGLGLFLGGWLVQRVGHYYEGRRPAFVDELAGLLVGPMFIAAEGLFALGLARTVAREIESRAGPTRVRDLAHPLG